MKKPLILLLLFLLTNLGQAGPEVRETVLGTQYKVDSRFLPELQKIVFNLRSTLTEQRKQGKLLAFVSIPLSSRGGGDRQLNTEIAEHIKRRLESRFGEAHFWALAPGLVESSIPAVDGVSAGGGDYMFMWTEILAGRLGLGEDFDMIYFSGPTDFADFFGFTGQDDLGRLKRFMNARITSNPQFAQSLSTPEKRRAFLRYYSMKASVTFSDGAHDEWNIFRLVNQKRREQAGIGYQLPIFFDGRQLPGAVTEIPISKGYEL